MADLRSIIWHFRKKIALAVFICCTVYAIYALQNCCTPTSHSGSSSKHTHNKLIPSLAGNRRKSGQLSGISRTTPSPQPNVVHDLKGKLISRTLIGLKEGNSSSDTPKYNVFNGSKAHSRKVNVAEVTKSSSDDGTESSEYISSSSSLDDDNQVEDVNVLNEPALLSPLPAEPDNNKTLIDPGYQGPLQTNQQKKTKKQLPSALIIGVKKGGTRALLEFIRLHPDVKAAGSETHFFDKFYDNGLEWYRSQMPPTLEGQITIEKTPGYFPNPDVPKRVYKMNKDIKLIIIFRDPVSRIISDYAQSLSKGPKAPMEELAMFDYGRGIVDSTWSPVKISMYADHLANWLPYFPERQLLFLNGENLVQNPVEELIKMQKFLNLDVIIDESYFYFNQTKGFPCLKKGETKQDPKCLGESKGRQHPTVDPFVVRRLQRFFQPHNKRLYQMTGIDFHWEDSSPAKL